MKKESRSKKEEFVLIDPRLVSEIIKAKKAVLKELAFR
jgi:hypothetical protein